MTTPPLDHHTPPPVAPPTTSDAGAGSHPVIPITPLTPIIIGPTAGGKTALAVELALAWHGTSTERRSPAEIVTADSIQVYRELDIGAAKPTAAERRGVPHHLIDLVEPTERFSVHDWLTACESTLKMLASRNAPAILVGGTHLYAKAFLEGLFEGPAGDESLRQRLREEGLPALRVRLESVDPEAARRIHPNDERRTIRALEVFELSGKPISELQQQWDNAEHRRPGAVLIGLDWPPELINPRINARVKQMIADGLVDECRALWDAGQFGPQAREALGYKQLILHFEHQAGLARHRGHETLDGAFEQIKIETRRFAKNQRTWLKRFRTFPGSIWIDAATTPPQAWPELILARLPQSR